MSFGRPVEPPDVGAFHEGDTTSGKGSSGIEGSGSWPTGRAHRPPASDGSMPITTAGSARSRIADSSRSGSRDDTGCGIAPIFQQAANATNHAVELGRAIVTMSPTPAP